MLLSLCQLAWNYPLTSYNTDIIEWPLNVALTSRVWDTSTSRISGSARLPTDWLISFCKCLYITQTDKLQYWCVLYSWNNQVPVFCQVSLPLKLFLEQIQFLATRMKVLFQGRWLQLVTLSWFNYTSLLSINWFEWLCCLYLSATAFIVNLLVLYKADLYLYNEPFFSVFGKLNCMTVTRIKFLEIPVELTHIPK